METLSYCQLMQRCIELTAQRDALVAENVGLKRIPKNESVAMLLALDSFRSESLPDVGLQKAFETLMYHRETPATDAEIASLRAEGVEMLLTEKFNAEIAGVLADFDGVDDATLQTVIWSGQPPEPDGDVWHIEYMTRGYQVQKKIREFARQLRESKGAQS
ncbi:hypothetical protein [Phage vB_KsaM-C1]|nr:hypothetical protein [Phage vB_KsaM-C1]